MTSYPQLTQWPRMGRTLLFALWFPDDDAQVISAPRTGSARYTATSSDYSLNWAIQ